MPYTKIPKDLSGVKTKVVFGLTKRQLICFSLAVAIGLPLFFMLRDHIGNSLSVFAMILCMFPFFMLAMYERHGQPLEVLLKDYIGVRFLCPKARPYMTNNTYEALDKEHKVREEVSQVLRDAKAQGGGLTSAERRQIQRIIKRANQKPRGVKSVQDTLPYRHMFPDGLCHVEGKLYSRTVRFEDTNYHLALNDDKDKIFGGWCDLLNYFSDEVKFQLSFLNTTVEEKEFEESIYIPPQDDEIDGIRAEYSDMLRSQLSRGNNGIVRTKYITFSVEAENIRTAKSRLARIENDVINILKRLGVQAHGLDGTQRLKLCHNILHMDGRVPFAFDRDMQTAAGLSTKDFIVPSSFTFGEKAGFQTGDLHGAVSFLQVTSPKISDRVLSDFMEVQSSQLLTMHIEPIEQSRAIKMIKRKLTAIDSMKIGEQKRAFKDGYDSDIMPSDLITYGGEAQGFLSALQDQSERMFHVTFIVANAARSKKELDNTLLQLTGIGNRHDCNPIRLDYNQEHGFMSGLPIGKNLVQIKRSLTTSGTAIFMPFTTREMFSPGGDSLYYGLNALSNNLIMLDRKLAKNPNGLILGVPGSGKSFAAKMEIASVILRTKDDVYVCDPEGEYHPIIEQLGGQIVKISPTSRQYINPMDINLDHSDEDNPLALKSDFLISLCELVVGGRDGLSPIDISVIDRCVSEVYAPYLADPRPHNMPILQDLYNALGRQKESEAKRIRAALEIYVNGSLRVFNHRTNVDIHNRLVCFDIKQLGTNLKKLGMLVVQDQIWNRLTLNRSQRRSTRYYIDELHLLLAEKQTADYTVEIWKRFRKWGGIPTGITQNAGDLMASRKIGNIFENSDFIYMLSQGPGDRELLTKQLGISADQLTHIKGGSVGEGLLYCGGTIVPFVNKFPQNTELYRAMTTKLTESMVNN